MKYNEFGEELPDDTPVEVPLRVRVQRPPTIQELIAMYVRQERALERQMGRTRSESEEEEDFDVDEEGEDEILTPYELHALAAETEREENDRRRDLARYKGMKYGDQSEQDVKGAGSDRKGAAEDTGSKGSGSAGGAEDVGGSRAAEAGTAGKR